MKKKVNEEVYLSGGALESLGWKKRVEKTDGNTVAVYERGFDTLKYDGVCWMYYGFPGCIKNVEGEGVRVEAVRVEYFEDLK